MGMIERDWDRVFELRCKSKRGETLSQDARLFLEAAYKENPERYSDMNHRVFVETAPFGSTV